MLNPNQGIKIAILIPCYNSANFLPELFEGIKSQSVPFHEVLCYDDYSTDNTIEIAERLGAKVIRGDKNRGPAYARNRLIEACNSEYIHFHDSDDLIHANFVETIQKYIQDEDVQILCNAFVLDRNNRSNNLGNITYDSLSTADDQTLFFIDNIGFASVGLYSKKALKAIDGFNEQLIGNEDPDLHIRLSIAGFKIKAISEFLITKLEHSESLSHTRWNQCLADKLKCLENYSSILSSNYHPALCRQGVQLSNYFYKENLIELSFQAASLVKKCGNTPIRTSPFNTFISTYCGTQFYMWLFRRRVDLKLI
ncbi:MAG TPA: glycosyltransferase family A protein [Pedobacter sp.]|jgi:glycosyltransferase involved in cell wall biosynthesis